MIKIIQDSLHPQDIFITAGKRRSSVTSDRRVPSEELQQSPSVNARSQEGSISEPLLKIFKTSGRRRSLLEGEFLVWSSLCKARRQEGQSLVTRINVNFFKKHICIQSFCQVFIILFPQLPAQHQVGYVQYFLALVLAGRARFLAPCSGRREVSCRLVSTCSTSI